MNQEENNGSSPEMAHKKILLSKPNVISKSKKHELKLAGYIVVETEKFSDVKLYDELGIVDNNTLLSAALESLNWGNDRTSANAFGDLLRKKLLARLKNVEN